MNTEQSSFNDDRPIGFWIKATDQALDCAIDAIHADVGLTRRSWQILNVIVKSHPISLADLIAYFAPMLASDPVRKEVCFLSRKQIVRESRGLFEPTRHGLELHKRASANQIEFRRKAIKGISKVDYAATLRCLSKMVDNLT